jgi:hypothetical protein
MGFEPRIPMFELAKTVHALDLAASAIALNILGKIKLLNRK